MTKMSKSVFRSFLIFTASVLILGLGLGLYVYYLRASLNAELQTYLEQVAQQNVKILNIQFDGNFKALQSAASALSAFGELQNRNWAPLLEEETRRNGYKRMGFVLPNGLASLSDEFLINLSGQPHFEKALGGQPAVSDPIADSVDNKEIMVMAVPVYSSGTVSGVLFASLPQATYNNLLLADSFDGAGYSLVVKSNGDKVMASRKANTDPAVKNIFRTSLNKKLDLNGRMRRNMQAGKSGSERFYRPGQGWLDISYKPVGINDWYLLSVVPEKVATQKTKNLLFLSLILCGTGLFVFVSLLAYIYLQNRRTHSALSRIAYTDRVTGRSNWAKIQQEIPELLARCPDRKYAFVVFDVNKFKVANDRLGYAKADALLRCISETFCAELQTSELGCRVGADVFAMLLHFDTREQLKNRLELMNEKITGACPSDLGAFQFILSFGVYPLQDTSQAPTDMLLRAILARDTVKGHYDDIVGFYDEAFRQKVNLEQTIENNMEDALVKKEFSLLLAPIRMINGALAAAESVPAWQPQEKPLVPPEVFLPVFAKNGFITRLDVYMAAEACRALKRWREEKTAYFPIALDVSAASLRSPYFSTVLFQLTRQYDVAPSDLILQLTPQAESADLPFLRQLAEGLHHKGFQLALNHFSRGTVSLDLIKTLPIDMIKMEGEFLKDLESNPKTRQILSAFIGMAKALKLRMVFDGVEYIGQLHTLRELGADLFQGPLAGTPTTPDQLPALLPFKQ